jgi:hypothetical protein
MAERRPHALLRALFAELPGLAEGWLLFPASGFWKRYFFADLELSGWIRSNRALLLSMWRGDELLWARECERDGIPQLAVDLREAFQREATLLTERASILTAAVARPVEQAMGGEDV